MKPKFGLEIFQRSSYEERMLKRAEAKLVTGPRVSLATFAGLHSLPMDEVIDCARLFGKEQNITPLGPELMQWVKEHPNDPVLEHFKADVEGARLLFVGARDTGSHVSTLKFDRPTQEFIEGKPLDPKGLVWQAYGYIPYAEPNDRKKRKERRRASAR